jgi:F-type H+-transporting ATPase subunit b
VLVTLMSAAAAEKGAEAQSSGMPQFDLASFPGQIFWLAIAFGLLYWMVSSIFSPRIAATVDGREKRITDDLAEARRLNTEAQAAAAEHEKAVAKAKADARSLALDTRAKLAAETQRETDALEAELSAKVSAAEARIAASAMARATAARDAAADAVQDIVAKVSGLDVAAADAAKAVASLAGGRV